MSLFTLVNTFVLKIQQILGQKRLITSFYFPKSANEQIEVWQ